VAGFYAGASRPLIAVVMALGSGVLVSSVAFELMDEAYKIGGLVVVAVTTVGFLLAFELSRVA
jgi:ZIP family zinc transporter